MKVHPVELRRRTLARTSMNMHFQEQAFCPAESYVQGYLSTSGDNGASAIVRHAAPGDCFALRLFERMRQVAPEQAECAGFYEYCAAGFQAGGHADDHEMLVIHLKQMAMIARAAGLDPVHCKPVCGSADVLWDILFGSFWNLVEWQAIFPSMPDDAMLLHQNRAVVLELLSSQNGALTVDQLLEDYLLVTGHQSASLVMLASFLDFSLLTWLSHFGVLSFSGGADCSVAVGLTNFGRSYLLSLDE